MYRIKFAPTAEITRHLAIRSSSMSSCPITTSLTGNTRWEPSLISFSNIGTPSGTQINVPKVSRPPTNTVSSKHGPKAAQRSLDIILICLWIRVTTYCGVLICIRCLNIFIATVEPAASTPSPRLLDEQFDAVVENLPAGAKPQEVWLRAV